MLPEFLNLQLLFFVVFFLVWHLLKTAIQKTIQVMTVYDMLPSRLFCLIIYAVRGLALMSFAWAWSLYDRPLQAGVFGVCMAVSLGDFLFCVHGLWRSQNKLSNILLVMSQSRAISLAAAPIDLVYNQATAVACAGGRVVRQVFTPALNAIVSMMSFSKGAMVNTISFSKNAFFHGTRHASASVLAPPAATEVALVGIYAAKEYFYDKKPTDVVFRNVKMNAVGAVGSFLVGTGALLCSAALVPVAGPLGVVIPFGSCWCGSAFGKWGGKSLYKSFARERSS